MSRRYQNNNYKNSYGNSSGGGYYQSNNYYYNNNYSNQGSGGDYYNNNIHNQEGYYNTNASSNNYGNQSGGEGYYNATNSGNYYNHNKNYKNKRGARGGRGGRGGYNNYSNQGNYDYSDNQVDYAPKEIYEATKNKNAKIIVKEITAKDPVIYDDDLLDNYHGDFREQDRYVINDDGYNDEDLDALCGDGGDDYGYTDNYKDDNYNESASVSTQFSKMNISQSTGTPSNFEAYYSNYNSKNPLTFTNESGGFTEKVDQMSKHACRSYYNNTISDSFVNVLMIAEKPSIAKMISEVLSNGHAKERKMGRGKVLNFEGYFKNAKARFTVSAVAGHVYTSDFLREHNKWDAIDPCDLYDVPITKLEAMKKSHIPETLQRLASEKDILCLWLDCDKEGENICYEVIYNAIKVMNKKNYQQIYRAKFSSLTKKDLKFAFDTLQDPPNKNESLSVDCRQVIDLKIGVSFTRFLTSSILPGLDVPESCKMLSYGPCQTPTLWFCVNRQVEINKFVPKEYYKPYVEVEINMNKHKIKYKRIYNKNDLSVTLKKIKEVKEAIVIDVTSTKNTKTAPVGWNTVSLLRAASSYLKISPHNTMVIAERLYTMGYITYPRTETTKYASSFDFLGNLKNFASHPSFGRNVTSIINTFKKPIPKGVDVGDHPPITPSRVATKEQLSGDSWRLYECICVNFFASLSPAAEYDDISYKIDVNGEIFEESSMKITNEGFLLFLPHKRKNYEKDFPLVLKDTKLKILGSNYESNWTEPPDYLTESDLIKEMEKNKIGTDASMPVHIENICQRGYVKVDANRRLIPTKLGKGLIEALGEVDPTIIHPQSRAKIEELMDEVAHGKKKYQEVLKYAMDWYRERFVIIRVHYDKWWAAFGKYFTLDMSKMAKTAKTIKQKNEQFKKDTFVQKKESEVSTDINICDECHHGKMYIDYDKFDKYCLFCTNCKRRTKIIRDAITIEVNKGLKCDKCNSYYITVEVENPFWSGETKYTGCLLCDRHLQ